MEIDLNKRFTSEDVAALLASKDDSQHRQIRVTADGQAFLSDEVGAQNIEGLCFRLETLSAGAGYVGVNAANDPVWVARIEAALRAN